MNSVKRLSLVFFLLACCFTVLISSSGRFGHQTAVCNNKVVRAFMPWDSACFYRALFSEENDLGDLLYENYKLGIFTRRGGLNPGVLWYRANFYRQYRHVLPLEFTTLDQYHWEYMRVQPHKVDELFRYMSFLEEGDFEISAQQTLNRYCDLYLDGTHSRILGYSAIVSQIRSNNLHYDASHCSAYIDEEEKRIRGLD